MQKSKVKITKEKLKVLEQLATKLKLNFKDSAFS